jgi:hypothetical protein
LIVIRYRVSFPDKPIESNCSAVKVMTTEIAIELVNVSIKRKPTFRYATRVASHGRANIGIRDSIFVATEVGKSEHYVVFVTVAVGSQNFDQAGSPCPNSDSQTGSALKAVFIDWRGWLRGVSTCDANRRAANSHLPVRRR